MVQILPAKWKAIAIFLFGSMHLAVSCRACCAVATDNRVAVNADQTVIMLWDAAQKTEHFIRQASFKSDADDVGFIVPTPSRPQLEESGDSAFSTLLKITAPRPAPFRFPVPSCSVDEDAEPAVTVIEQKRVAGYDATVLTAKTGAALVAWLLDHGYRYSPQVAAWAQPYVAGGWMMIALKVAKPKDDRGQTDLRASALRLSFQTDRPLFPYREPESAVAAQKLGTSQRLLRIFFISDARYLAAFGNGSAWSGKAVWSGDITAYRSRLLSDLKLPAQSGPAHWRLTEFEDHWPYAPAIGDVYFAPDPNQGNVAQRADRPAHYDCDLALTAFFAFAALRPFLRRRG